MGGGADMMMGGMVELRSKQLSDGTVVTQRLPRVKQIASKTFFLRGERFVDADATQAQIDSATKIEQCSDAYFELLQELDEPSREYFAEESELLVVIRGKAYLITPPSKAKAKDAK